MLLVLKRISEGLSGVMTRGSVRAVCGGEPPHQLRSRSAYLAFHTRAASGADRLAALLRLRLSIGASAQRSRTVSLRSQTLAPWLVWCCAERGILS